MSLKSYFSGMWFKVSLALPGPFQVALAGGKPMVARGHSMDPSVQLLAHYSAGQPALNSLPVETARAAGSAGYAALSAPPRKDVLSEDRTIVCDTSSIEVRVCSPTDRVDNDVLVLFYHPGGWVIGDLDSGHAFCTEVSGRTGATVISVDYRLAPESPFPAAAEDAFAAYDWAIRNAHEFGADPNRIIVAGESAGGNLAAAICQFARSTGLPQPCGQYLVSPVLDLKNRSKSYSEIDNAFPLTAELMEWFIGHYTDLDDADDVRASPLLAQDFSGLAPAIVVTAGFDPLVDEGAAYAEKLSAAGVEVTYVCEHSAGHGILTMSGLSRSCMAASDRCVRLLTDFIGSID